MSAHWRNEGSGAVRAAQSQATGRPPRRVLLRRGLAAAITLLGPVVARPALAARMQGPARLAFYNTHTAERIDVVYRDANGYVPDALAAIAQVLRDHRNDTVKAIDPELLEQLHRIGTTLGAAQPFHVISGYRSPETNSRLAAASGGVARHSLHLEGRAIDIRVPGRPLADLHRVALELRAGGVGRYVASDFIHIDTGRVRTW